MRQGNVQEGVLLLPAEEGQERGVGALSCKVYLNGRPVSFPVQATPGTAERLGSSAGH